MGNVHAAAWNETKRGVVLAVADSSLERARDLAERHARTATVVGSLEDLLAQGQIDAVDICLPHHLHAPTVIQAARAGVHVLCEKPLCLSFGELRAIRAAIREGGVHLMCAHNKLFTPAFARARRLVESGAVGTLFHVQVNEVSRNLKLRLRKPPVELVNPHDSYVWRLDPARMGGAQLIDTGWHAVYQLLTLAGSRPTEVVALLGNHVFEELHGEDTGYVLVRFESGAQGVIVTSWAFEMDSGAAGFQVAGSAGRLAGSATRLVFAGTTAGPERRWRWRTSSGDTFRCEVEHFFDVVVEGVRSEAGLEDAARTLQLVLSAYRSARESRVVSLPADPLVVGADGELAATA
jgi:predicted dehydrogenase